MNMRYRPYPVRLPIGGWQGTVLLCLVSLAFPLMAAVDARVDRAQIYDGDVFTLFIEQRGSGAGDPDLSPLQQDFEIVGTGTSSSFSVVNGRSSSRVTWRVQLRPLRMGELTIPSINVGNEQTPAIALTVADVPLLSATSADAPAFVEVDVAGDGPFYVQQQIPVTVRLLQGERVVGGELDRMQIDGALIESLGAERRYTANRDGRSFRVTERRYAVAAERSGSLQIPAISFRGRVAQPRPESGGRGYPPGTRGFGGQPFQPDLFSGRSRDSGGVQPIRVASEAVTVDVLPPAVTDSEWLPAKQLTLQDSWADNPPQLRQGEPVMRVITLQATGLNGKQLPALDIESPAAANVYSDASASDTRSDGRDVFGLSRQSFTYVPSQAGAIDVPPLTLRWWNTVSGRAEEARLQGLRLSAAASATAGNAPLVEETADAPQGLSWWWITVVAIALALAFAMRSRVDVGRIQGWVKGHLRDVVQRVSERKASVPPDSSEAPVPQPVAATPAEPAPTVQPSALQVTNQKSVRDQQALLKEACMTHDPHAAAQTLLSLGRLRWPVDPPTNLGDLGQRLGRGGSEVAALDRVLYGLDDGHWDGAALWSVMQRERWTESKRKSAQGDRSDLEPLYPQKA